MPAHTTATTETDPAIAEEAATDGGAGVPLDDAALEAVAGGCLILGFTPTPIGNLFGGGIERPGTEPRASTGISTGLLDAIGGIGAAG